VGTLLGKRPIVKPRRKQNDNIKINFVEEDCEEKI
jgi:hypothetical protein